MDLTNQIEEYIQEADILSEMLEQTCFMFEKFEGRPDLQEPHFEELQMIIEEYVMTLKALKFLFAEYFEWEKMSQTPRNLRYRRLNKLLLEDLAKPVPPKSR